MAVSIPDPPLPRLAHTCFLWLSVDKNLIFVIKATRVYSKKGSHYFYGPLQLVRHVAQKLLAGEQETHWDKTNKELTSCPTAFLAHQQGVFYHVTD